MAATLKALLAHTASSFSGQRKAKKVREELQEKPKKAARIVPGGTLAEYLAKKKS